MSNQFQSRPKKDNEATMRLFIDKLFGKDSTSFGETGITDAKEAFHSARSILQAAGSKSTDSFHSAQSILRAASVKSTDSASANCCSKKQPKETKQK